MSGAGSAPRPLHPLLPEAPLAGRRGADGSLHRLIRRTVLDRILSGAWPAGRRVSVSRLARESGMSRTPVRETLLQLQREGFLALEENRGFFVPELTEGEARELYPILHALEDLAVVKGGRPPREQLERLERMNDRLAASDDPEEAITLNFAWHRILTEPCGNRELLGLLDQYRMRVYRYEHTYYGPGEARLAYSVELHGRILDALRAGDLRGARVILEHHWVGDYALYLPKELTPAPPGSS